MKNIFLSLFSFLCICINAQDCPKYPSKAVMDNTDLIFEGRIISDSSYLQRVPGDIRTYHKVIVLKQFKGTFKSDTISLVTYGGNMIINGNSEGTPGAFAFAGDEAVIFATVMKLGNKDPDLYYVLYGHDGYVKTCGTSKDVVKDIYESIEATTGQKYIEVHPNNCAALVKPKNK